MSKQRSPKRPSSVRARRPAGRLSRAALAHDLMTPITAIKGYAEILLGGTVATPAQRARLLRIIERNADRLTQLVRDRLEPGA